MVAPVKDVTTLDASEKYKQCNCLYVTRGWMTARVGKNVTTIYAQWIDLILIMWNTFALQQ